MSDDERAISRASETTRHPLGPYTMTPAEFAHTVTLADTIEAREQFEGETYRLWTQLRALIGHYRH